MVITQHRLDSARQIDSPNFDDRPNSDDISLIVIHGISLPPGEFGTGCVEQLFCNGLDPNRHSYFQGIYQLRVSSHLFIERGGEIVQFVPFDKRAWHAGLSSYKGREKCNDFSIGIELEGTDDMPYTDSQYSSLAKVVRALLAGYPLLSEDSIAGHCDIAPGRKTDPGEAFDWERFQTLLK